MLLNKIDLSLFDMNKQVLLNANKKYQHWVTKIILLNVLQESKKWKVSREMRDW